MSRLAIPVALLLTLVAALGTLAAACTDTEGVNVRIDGLVIEAELARTPEERARGLSGRESLADDAGMLFVFQAEGQHAFWMRGMRFPLDFVWVSSARRVVDMTENVPPPAPGVPDANLPRYQPAEPVLYVLEVNAGVVREAGLQLGDLVTFEPDISMERTPQVP